MVFVSVDKTNIGSQLIEFVQQRIDKANSRWTHVAVYIGNGEIIEAVPTVGVQQTTIWNYVATREIEIYRDPFVQSNPSNGLAIAAAAALLLNHQYTKLFALPVAGAMGSSAHQDDVDTILELQKSVVCTNIVASSYLQAGRQNPSFVSPVPNRYKIAGLPLPIMPCQLIPFFDPVSAVWRNYRPKI